MRTLRATVVTADVRGPDVPLRFTLRADTVHVSGRAFERVESEELARGRAARLRGQRAHRQDSLVSYAVRGSYAQPMSGVRVVQLDSLRATFDTLVWRLVEPGVAPPRPRRRGGEIHRAPQLERGRIWASAQVPGKGPIFLNVEADGVRIATLLQTLQHDTDADGIVSASALVQETPRCRRSRDAPVCAQRASKAGVLPTWT